MIESMKMLQFKYFVRRAQPYLPNQLFLFSVNLELRLRKLPDRIRFDKYKQFYSIFNESRIFYFPRKKEYYFMQKD
jgi:hypothetical protein